MPNPWRWLMGELAAAVRRGVAEAWEDHDRRAALAQWEAREREMGRFEDDVRRAMDRGALPRGTISR
jgi:hypothetical protein